MSLLTWLADQKLSDWVQGLGSLSAAGAAVGIALRQERLDRRRTAAAAELRAQVLAAAIVPVLRDMQGALRIRSGLLQATRRLAADEHPPNAEELAVMLPDIFMNTIERADVFGAPVAAQLYTLIHRVEDYNRYVRACREWGVPPRQWDASLRPKLDAIGAAVAFLEPRLAHHIDTLEANRPAPPPPPRPGKIDDKQVTEPPLQGRIGG
jgi:hypothetical protein